jgi:hypothetical protein
MTASRFISICFKGIIALCLSASSVYGIGVSYADNQVFPYGYIDVDRAGPLALADYPGLTFDGKFGFQTSRRSLYDMKELTDNRAALAVGLGRWQLSAAAALFGEGDYFQQMGLSSSVSYRQGAFAAGVSIVYSRLSFGPEYDDLSLLSVNLGAAYHRKQASIFAVTRAVNQPRYYESGARTMPEGEVGLSYRSGEGLDSQTKALFVRGQKPTAELSQAFRLNGFARLNWALVLLPARFGAGLSLEKGHWGFEYRYSHHPVLGGTHTVILSVS